MQEKNGSPEARDGAAGLQGLIALHRRHLDALTVAVKSALDGAHTIASRQCDAVAEAHRQLAPLLAAPLDLSGCMSPGLDFVKRALATGVAQTVALTEIATKAQVEALTIVGRSVADNLDGLKPALYPGETDLGRTVGT